jgi:hypothetical protein
LGSSGCGWFGAAPTGKAVASGGGLRGMLGVLKSFLFRYQPHLLYGCETWSLILGEDSRFRFPAGAGNILFTTASRTALGSTQPPSQWVPGDLSLGVKRTGREADPSPPSSAEVKEGRKLYLHSPNTTSWRGA